MDTLISAERAKLSRDDITSGLSTAFGSFAELIERRTPDEWSTPTRCAGWEVRDVAAHVVAQAEDVVTLTIGQRTPDEHAAALRGEPPAELAGRLRAASDTIVGLISAFDDAGWNGPSPAPDTSVADGVLALIADAYVHADDIHEAIGRPVDRGDLFALALTRTVQRLQDGGSSPMRLELDGVEPIEVGSGGPTIATDPHHFILVATGRADPTTLGLDASVNLYA